MTEGSIIFLSRRKGISFRAFISYLIACFSTKNRAEIDCVPVHTAIIFRCRGELCVRDMDYNGNTLFSLEEYRRKYAGRGRIKINPYEDDVTVFNVNCRCKRVKYDFLNLLIFQVFKSFFGVFVGKNTIRYRICSEDCARMFNKIKPIFRNPEQITPSEIDKFISWNELYF